jgi:peptidoglycan/LPS O-acetylase OafA/YrhL
MASPQVPGSTGYRADIDGLRGIAVLGVVGYHAFPRAVPGGFVGVDIFFVISGYLISSLIYLDLERHRFSYTGFYARRFRRIFPALITVLLACLIYGWFVLLPDELRELGKQTAASAGFGANILFWRESGYFDARASLKPLLHLWSLGVEEQFYLTWPIVIVLAYARATRLLGIAAGVVLASFCACAVLTRTDPSAAFYLPVTRFWELLLGAMLAYFVGGNVSAHASNTRPQRGVEFRPWSSELLAGLGLLTITLALLLIDKDRSFPGWWALLPTVGTALVIAAPCAWLNRHVLANRILVFVGLISYPLYLWHWVLLTFARIANYGDDLPKSWRLTAIVSAFVLAWLTYRLIEKPIRFSPRRGAIPYPVVASMAVCGVLGLLAYETDGGAFRYPLQMRALAATRYDSERDYYEDVVYRGGACFLGPNESFANIGSECVDRPNGTSRLVALWGDSHAASLYPGMHAAQSAGHFRLAQFNASACPPVLGVRLSTRQNCEAFNDAVLAQLRVLKPDVVVLEAHWALYHDDDTEAFDSSELRKTVAALQQLGIGRIVVMGSLPSWKIYQPRVALEIWRRQHVVLDRTRQFLDPAVFQADDFVRAAVRGTGAIFVSPLALLCDPRGCLISTDAHVPTPVAWDNDHLSIAGSSLLANRALKEVLGR